MAPGNEGHFGRQSPALGQHAARFGMMRSEFFLFKIEHVQAALGGIADHPFVLVRIRHQ